MTLLAVNGLEAGYGPIQVLRDVGFSVDDGEFLGILGHNGMGKSTLLKTLAGEISATRGSIRFDGKEISLLPSHLRARAGIGYVPQGRQIFPALTVRENMKMAALGGHQPLEIVDRVLARFPRLHPIVDRMGGVLSGGEQQILALARCLCGAPKIMLLDEPTEGVQPSIRDEIVDTLHQLRSESGLTVLLVEQNVKFMESLADRVLHMDRGCLHTGAPQEVW
jgi:ABC-type branched-subunit amino acid transport system ATPase component